MELSVVVPLHCEEESVALLHQRIEQACAPMGVPFEVVYVDDGSTDATWDRLLDLEPLHGEIVLVRLRRNYGQTAGMAAGFDLARGRYVVSMDGDLQNDPSDIPALVERSRQGYDLVCGWRKNRQDKLWSRKLPSRCANWLIRKVTRVHIHDYGCSLKLYTRDLLRRMRLYSDMHRFLPFIAQRTGARVDELVVQHHARQFGRTKYGIGRTWKVLLDLIGLKMLVHYGREPFVVFATLAMLPLLAALPFGVAWLTGGANTALLHLGSLVVLLNLALITVFLGILGQGIREEDEGRSHDLLCIWDSASERGEP